MGDKYGQMTRPELLTAAADLLDTIARQTAELEELQAAVLELMPRIKAAAALTAAGGVNKTK